MEPSGTLASGPACAVVGPWLYLTVTIEQEAGRPHVHLHPGGQGFWIARILTSLGCDSRLVGPLGGEAGVVLQGLVPSWGVAIVGPTVKNESPVQVHDRRDGDRRELVAAHVLELDRHETDDLYSAALAQALEARAVVLTAAGVLPVDAYRRFTHDLADTGTLIGADMHGDALDAALAGGPIDVVKVSEDDLAADGWDVGSEARAIDVARSLHRRGAATVVISRGGEPAVVATGDRIVRVTAPTLDEVDHRGAGDSMSGATMAALLYGFPPLDAVRFGAAAGAGNVIRHGLGSGSPELVTRLAELVVVEELS